MDFFKLSSLKLLLARSHQADIIVVKRLIQGLKKVTRVLVEPTSCDQGRRKNDAFTISGTQPNTIVLKDAWKISESGRDWVGSGYSWNATAAAVLNISDIIGFNYLKYDKHLALPECRVLIENFSVEMHANVCFHVFRKIVEYLPEEKWCKVKPFSTYWTKSDKITSNDNRTLKTKPEVYRSPYVNNWWCA